MPFVVSRRRLEPAIRQLKKEEADGGHEAFRRCHGTDSPLIQVDFDNLDSYDYHGAEPHGLNIQEVDSNEKLELDPPLLAAWLQQEAELQLNIQVLNHLNDAVQ